MTTKASPLGMWLQRNRSQRRSNLTDEQVDKLNALGMDWESVQSKNERHWLSMLELLKTYKKEFKDIYVKKEQIYKGQGGKSWKLGVTSAGFL